MSKVAYLAQPIDQVYDLTMHANQANKIAEELNRIGYAVYLPARAWRVTQPPQLDRRLEEVNELALRLVDVLVAYLPAGVPTIGVPMEINRAVQWGVPVVVITEVQSFSLQRDGVIVIDQLAYLVDAISAHEHNHPRFGQPVPGVLYHPDPAAEPIRMVVREGAKIPARSYLDDAGLDLTTATQYTVGPGQFVDIHTQVDAVQLPDGYWGMITGRSSTLRKHGLHVPVAVIDPGWRGPLFVGVWNLGQIPVTVNPGDRLGQLILLRNNPAPVLPVTQVQDADRGLAGFGSSGT